MLRRFRAAGRCAALLLLCSAATGQATWVLDPGGSGNFTDLGVALTSIGPGDTLILRGGGVYGGNYATSQPVHLVGETPRSSILRLNLNHPPGSGTSSVSNADVAFSTALGPSAWEDVAVTSLLVVGTIATLNRCPIGDPASSASGVVAQNGAHVALTECVGVGGRAGVLVGSSCLGIPGAPPLALRTGSNASVFGCTLTGAPTAFVICAQAQAGAAIECPADCALTIGASTVQGGIAGAFSTFSGTFAPSGPVASAPAGIRGNGGAPGGQLQFRLEGPPNTFVALAYSADLHTPVPFPPGLLWVDPLQFTVVLIASNGPTGVLAVGLPVPLGIPRGIAVTTQGALLQATGLVPSLPAGLLVL